MSLNERLIRIGTRGSKLALWQANDLMHKLDRKGIKSELIVIQTKGDQVQHLSLDKIEGKGFFTSEIENALKNTTIDVAVHSMKDLPTAGPEGLIVAGISERAAPNDLLIARKSSCLDSEVFGLKKQAKIGTSSHRRKCWLRHFRPDFQLVDLRGNVPTRLRKLHEEDLDAIVLAEAGIQRLNIPLTNVYTRTLHPREFVPAPAQGTIAYQIRSSDEDLRRLLYGLSDKQLISSIQVERKILKLLDGGCHSPIGVYCTKDKNGFLHVTASYAKVWQDPPVFVSYSSGTSHELAETIVEKLKEKI